MMTFYSCPYCKSHRVVEFGDMTVRMARCLDCGGQWQPLPRVSEVAEKAEDHWQPDPSRHSAADGEADRGWLDILEFDD